MCPTECRSNEISTENVPCSATCSNSKKMKCETSQDDSMFPLKVKLLSENGRLPERASHLAAGYDLFRYFLFFQYLRNFLCILFVSAEDKIVPSKGKVVVPTDLSIAVPVGTYGRVAPRSGLAVKHFIDVGAGVIDADYRGPLGVILFNFSDLDFPSTNFSLITRRNFPFIVLSLYIPYLNICSFNSFFL